MFKKFIFVIFFSFLSVSELKANDKISYVDMDYIITNTIVGKSLLENFKKEEKLKNLNFATLLGEKEHLM